MCLTRHTNPQRGRMGFEGGSGFCQQPRLMEASSTLGRGGERRAVVRLCPPSEVVFLP
ncbi:hypothetical protein OK006_10386 [Actinobacteria bacterium OK006]|nr:hypothetical protein OK006_10386 [Actinobacteria bacterium OK006]